MTNKKRVGWKAVGVMLALGGCAHGHEATAADPESETNTNDVAPRLLASTTFASPSADTAADTAAPTAADTDAPTDLDSAIHHEPELVEHCARLRSLPQWCMERERARVRKRGTP